MPAINTIFSHLFDIRNHYKNNFVDLWHYISVKIYLTMVLLTNAAAWYFTGYINRQIGEGSVALHYNVDFGINLLGDVKKIYILPLLGFLVILINFILLININRTRERMFLTHILLGASLLVNLALLVGAGTIYLINFR